MKLLLLIFYNGKGNAKNECVFYQKKKGVD